MGRWVAVVIGASILASFSDWLFMGVLFHERYAASPALWRTAAGRSEPRAIAISQVIGIVSCAAFAILCVRAGALTIPASLGAAVLVWLAGPVVVLAQMAVWTRLHTLIVVSHALGWLARFVITGVLAAWLL